MSHTPSASSASAPTTLASVVRHDAPASLVVFLVALPLCMGIAIASGAPVASGLITGIVGGLVVGTIAGSPLQVSGPAAGLTVIVYAIVQQHGLEFLAAAVLLAGIVQIVAGSLRLGQWFRAVAPAVVQGMLSGIGILIFANQFHVMFDDAPKGSGLRNILAIPETLAQGLAFPASGDEAQRAAHSRLLQEARHWSESQTQIAKQLEQAAARRGDPVREAADAAKRPDLVARQQTLVAGLETLQAGVSVGNPLADEQQSEKLSAAVESSLFAARQALRDLQGPAEKDPLPAAKRSAEAAAETLNLLKRHDLAFQIGLVTIVAIVAWGSLKKTRLGVIPPQLVAVGLAAGLCGALILPVFYVDVPDRLWENLQHPTWEAVAQMDARALLTAVVTLAVVAGAETLLCATAVDQMHRGPRTKYDRELMAQGVGNTLCGLLGGLPMTGVIVRSAANVHAGAKSRWSAVLHGVWLLGFVALGGSLLRLIPTSSLAAILVLTGMKLMNFKVTRQLEKFGRGEVVVYGATVAGVVLLDLLTGVVLGIVLSALKMLVRFARLETSFEMRPDGRAADLHLRGAATFLRLPVLAAALERVPGNVDLHVHLDELTEIDHACFELLFNWQRQHEAQGGRLFVDWERLAGSFGPSRPAVPG